MGLTSSVFLPPWPAPLRCVRRLQDPQRLLGTARQQWCSTGVLGSAANNLVGNHRQYLSTGLSTDRALPRVPRGRHRVLPRL